MSYEIACVTMLVSYEPLKHPKIITFSTMHSIQRVVKYMHGSCTACPLYSFEQSCQDIFCRCFLLHMGGHFTVVTNLNSALSDRGLWHNTLWRSYTNDLCRVLRFSLQWTDLCNYV